VNFRYVAIFGFEVFFKIGSASFEKMKIIIGQLFVVAGIEDSAADGSPGIIECGEHVFRIDNGIIIVFENAVCFFRQLANVIRAEKREGKNDSEQKPQTK
jgi:hypothetical protein